MLFRTLPLNKRLYELLCCVVSGVNQVVLIGRAGGDAVMRGSEEKPVALFQLATSQSFKSNEGMCFSRVLHTICSHFRAHAFARSIMTLMMSSGEQDSSSSRQQRRWATVCGSPQSQFTDCVLSMYPPHCLCTANPSAQTVQRTPVEPRLVRPCWYVLMFDRYQS